MRRLPIANPCSEDWNSMRAEGQRRFCEVCDKHVHDLSSLTPRQAEELVRKKRNEMCVRYLHDGTDVLHLASARLPAERRVHGLAAAMVAGLLASCTAHGAPEPQSIDWEEPLVVAQTGPNVEIPDAPHEVEPCEPEPEVESGQPPREIRKMLGKPARREPTKGMIKLTGGEQGGL